MLEYLCIVSHGGLVLWEKKWMTKSFKVDPINLVIRNVLIEDRAGDSEYLCDTFKVRWSLANEAQFVVIGVYQRFLSLVHVDQLLADTRQAFLAKFTRGHKLLQTTEFDFADEFEALYSTFEATERSTDGFQSPTAAARVAAEEKAPASPTSPGGGAGSPSLSRTGSTITTASGRQITKRGGKVEKEEAKPAAQPKKPIKQPRMKDGANEAPVDNTPEPTEEEKLQARANVRNTYVRRNDDGSDAKVEEKKWENVQRGKVASWFRARFGTNRQLDEQDFKTFIPPLREKLIAKNVALEISETVCASVEATLRAKKLSTFESLPAAIEEAMVGALRRILEPRTEINILRSIAQAKERRKPYSIVFCGVNGVGKSTSLAKVTYWLQQNQCSVLLAACDTFRTGAVEQLMVHGDCLGVEVFSQGLSGANTDAAAVAGEALKLAARKGIDVVLIDTAGRMQDHESRMRALAKLIHDNVPDLVLFVGEAIVGNNGVDQLRKFNQCLVDFTPLGRQPRGIDGIVLTKFDTIDDKVGAAVSMVYELGQPIVFVGVGQSYQDLKTITADVVVDMLMQ